jgi:TRAP-type C4-dicarboxylate transport system permease small subunit
MEVKANQTAERPGALKGLGAVVNCLTKIVDPLVRYTVIISAAAVALMMFMTFVSVVGRITFELPVKGYFELTELFMGLMVIFGVGYTAIKKGHVRVDIISNYASPRVNAILDLFAYGICFLLFVLISWQGFNNGLDNLDVGLTTSILSIPVFPFNMLLSVGTAILSLVFLRDFLQAVNEVSR